MHQPDINHRPSPKRISLQVNGLHCVNCATSLEKHLLRLGAHAPLVDYASGQTTFGLTDSGALSEIITGLEKLGYSVVDNAGDNRSRLPSSILGLSPTYLKAVIAATLTTPMLLAMFLPHSPLHNPWLQWILATPVFIIGVLHFGGSGLRSIRAGVANMDVLIVLGVIAGYFASVISLLKGFSHETIFFEATSSIVTFVMIGHLLEERAVRKTTTAIESLAAIQPRLATRLISKPGNELSTEKNISKTLISETVSVEELACGDLVQVNTGDTVPTDGIIETGSLSCDENMISGESLPVDRNVNDRVIGGTIALGGSAAIRVTAVGEDTVLSSIVKLVREAQQRKPHIQRLGDSVSAIFVPGVIVVSIIVLSAGILIFGLSPTQALVRALAIAVVACPCAMGLATPTAIMVALGRAAKSGILIRGGDTLERLASIKHIGFDKTGTLTQGDLRVSNLDTFQGVAADEAKSIISALERGSSHPIAKALSKLYSDYQARFVFNSLNEIKGVGIEGYSDTGDHYILGGLKTREKYDIQNSNDLVLLRNGQLIAALSLEDTVRPEASSVIKAIQHLGIETSIISGDTVAKTESVANAIGIEVFYGERLPGEKLEIIRADQALRPLAYVGDGINDAPTLAEASVGISLSSASDVAMQSAQVILSGNTLERLPQAVRLARITVRTIKQNLFWAFFYNIIAIPLAALGYISPLMGALLMTFSDVIIVANSLRIRFSRID